MAARKFKFVSPGVFLKEIDNSQLPKLPGGVGPVLIGRTKRGPSLKPVKVNSFQDFVRIFGETLPGNQTCSIDASRSSREAAPRSESAALACGESAAVAPALARCS